MQPACFEWFLATLTPKQRLGLVWEVLAGTAQSCARVHLSSLVAQALSCLEIFQDPDRFPAGAIRTKPTLLPRALALLSSSRVVLCCTLAWAPTSDESGQQPFPAAAKPGLGGLQLVAPFLYFDNQKSRMSWSCRKSQRTMGYPGGDLRSTVSRKWFIINQKCHNSLLSHKAPYTPLHDKAGEGGQIVNTTPQIKPFSLIRYLPLTILISWSFCFCSWQRWALGSQEIGVTDRKLWQSSLSLFE